MFPVGDSMRSRRRAIVTWLLIVATAAAFLYETALDEEHRTELIYACGLVPARWFDAAWARTAGGSRLDAWPLVTSMFLHGGWLHVISNLWVLAVFGDDVEGRLGPTRFLAFYLLCGFAAGALHVATNPLSRVPTIGASGAIAGVMGAYLVLFPRSRVVAVVPVFCFPLLFEMPAVIYLGVWFLLQLASGFFELGSGASAGGIAWWAHVGGFVAGIVLLRVFGVRREPSPAAAR